MNFKFNIIIRVLLPVITRLWRRTDRVWLETGTPPIVERINNDTCIKLCPFNMVGQGFFMFKLKNLFPSQTT